MPDRLPRVHAAEHRNLPKERCCQFSQRVHVGIWYILRAQKGSHIPTLRPKYVPYTYMDPLGNIQNLHELRGLAFSLKGQALQATRGQSCHPDTYADYVSSLAYTKLHARICYLSMVTLNVLQTTETTRKRQPTSVHARLRQTTPCRPEATRAIFQFRFHHDPYIHEGSKDSHNRVLGPPKLITLMVFGSLDPEGYPQQNAAPACQWGVWGVFDVGFRT